MDDSWNWVEEELKKMQEELPVDPEMIQMVDAVSVADFWKRRYEEEILHWQRKLDIKEDEKKELREKATTHESAIKELDWKLKELERRWEQEKLFFEDRIKSKEVEAELQKARFQWDTRIRVLEDENRSLKLHLSQASGAAVTKAASTPMPAGVESVRVEMDNKLKELEEKLKITNEQARKRLEELENEKIKVAKTLAEKEELFASEHGKWLNLEQEVGAMTSQMSNRLQNLKEREKEHLTIVEDLARGFAHRIRNYLGIMSGTVQLCIANYELNDDLKKNMNVIDKNVHDMLGSIEEFLNLARVPAMNTDEIEINLLLDEALGSYSDIIKAQNISIEKDYDNSMPRYSGDRQLLKSALENLIKNSTEAISGSGKIIVVTRYDKSQGGIQIEISDTGQGIPESNIKKVFQPYYTMKKDHKGLGLTSAKRIIDLHKGTLSLESGQNKGTRVIIQLFA